MPGTAGGTVVGKDTVTSVLLGSGVAGLHYDFCDWLAGEHQRPRCDDCHARIAMLIRIRSRLPGVTIQLLDANGEVLKTHDDRRIRRLSVRRSAAVGAIHRA